MIVFVVILKTLFQSEFMLCVTVVRLQLLYEWVIIPLSSQPLLTTVKQMVTGDETSKLWRLVNCYKV